jgi:hypothetical protein
VQERASTIDRTLQQTSDQGGLLLAHGGQQSAGAAVRQIFSLADLLPVALLVRMC